ncbi:MAG: PA0069 family radical SAM protein [Planctomycetes bacterium]|nr:PA0069 family radical SAM protein [Planctomycetota bacterium]
MTDRRPRVPRQESNPPNRFVAQRIEWEEGAPPVELHVLEEDARSVLSENDSPDVGFRWSVNPYRGCQHACAYCYARPSHQYLGLGAGTDFDTRIVVKRNAPECLALELARPGWRRERVAFSGNTDCYQPLEARYELTRRCLEVCLARATPIALITKSALVRRDAALLGRHTRELGSTALVSIPFADERIARAIEPFAPTPSLRFETLRVLAAAGVDCGVMIAPVIPGLSDDQIPRVLESAARAGARHAAHIALRLPAEVGGVFEERLRAVLPLRADKVLHAIEELRGGRRNDSRFGARMRGQGERWRMIEQLFDLHCRRLGLATHREPLPTRASAASRAEPRAEQRGLFDD